MHMRMQSPMAVQKDAPSLTGNHDVEQQHILSKFLVSYQARFKVTQRCLLVKTRIDARWCLLLCVSDVSSWKKMATGDGTDAE